MLAKSLNAVILSALVAFLVASPAAAAVPGRRDSLAAEDNCNNHIGRCDQNGCAGVFPSPNSIRGICSAGQFNGCPCNKCGDSNGSCQDNGCFGVNNVCTAGTFQGCGCN